MWRKVITGGSAAAAVWLMGTGVAQANGWFWKPAWPPVWRTAVKVEAVSAPAPVADGCPIESADGLSLFIASSRGDLDSSVVGDPNNIWVSDRASIGAPWQPPQKVPAPISLAGPADFCPTPVRGRSLMFVSNRSVTGACGQGDIFISRQSPANGWSEPVHLACAPLGPNTAGAEFSPSLVETPYGTFLFYSTNGTTGHQDIHYSIMRNDGTFGPGRLVDALNSLSEDIMPNVREREVGGYEIVYSSNRSGVGTPPDQDVYISFAWFLPGPWSRPVNVGPAVNTPATEQRSTLSHDGQRLYFGRSGDIYVSERVR